MTRRTLLPGIPQGTAEPQNKLVGSREKGSQKMARLLKLLASGQGHKRSLCDPHRPSPATQEATLRCGEKALSSNKVFVF